MGLKYQGPEIRTPPVTAASAFVSQATGPPRTNISILCVRLDEADDDRPNECEHA